MIYERNQKRWRQQVGRNDRASINIMAILIRHASTQLVDTTLTLVANRIVCETGDRQWRSKRRLGRISRSNDLRRKPSDSPEWGAHQSALALSSAQKNNDKGYRSHNAPKWGRYKLWVVLKSSISTMPYQHSLFQKNDSFSFFVKKNWVVAWATWCILM